MRSNAQKLNQAQEEVMIKDLQRALTMNDIQAREILVACQWNLNKASNYALDIESKGQRILEQYYRYVSQKKQVMGADEITEFCNELGIDIMDPIILYISYIFKSDTMGTYTEFDFLYGFTQFKCQSTSDLKKQIPKLRQELIKLDVLKQVYKFCFDFAKQKNRKDIDLQIAQGLWETLLKNQFPVMQKFLQFVSQIPEKDIKPISRDTYFMVWEFCNQIGNDLQKYDYLTGAWPTFIDAFYFYCHPENKPKV